jgi:alkanesulfonate monooxygenase SsuD/methylene tetrahydromethanopterin reductase-like flavin-dependent oxidoreductase (luciferase family)
LGVGSGATREEFELLGLDYDQRFRALRDALETMRKVWRGEPLAHGTLPILPGCESGPPMLIGAWRSPRWITLAVKKYQGWIASGLYGGNSSDLEQGMRTYREAGGTNAVLASVVVDFEERPQSAGLGEASEAALVCPPDEARWRIRRLLQLGFDEVLLVSPAGVFEDLERARDLF